MNKIPPGRVHRFDWVNMKKQEPMLTIESRPTLSSVTEISLVKSFFEGRNIQTVKAYKADLYDFAYFLKAVSLDEAAKFLLVNGHGHANQIALSYRAHLIESNLQPTTINRRLASIRSLIKLAQTLGLVNWELEIKNLKTAPYRDTRGPGHLNFAKILQSAVSKGNAKAIRDHAILRLLYDLALRTSEVINLDIPDVDLESNTISIMGKGRTQKEKLTLPEPTKVVLQQWIEIRCNSSSSDSALFLNFDRTNKGQSKRLTRTGLYQLIRGLGEKLNIKTRPHGIRHTAITEACKLAQKNGFGLEEILDFSRHANVSTLMIYRDHEENNQGNIAKIVANTISLQKK